MTLEIVAFSLLVIVAFGLGMMFESIRRASSTNPEDVGVMMKCELGHRFSVTLFDSEISPSRVLACPVCSWWGRHSEVFTGGLVDYPHEGGA